jgi:N-acetylglucosamine-6-phosphate deacetylase
VRNLMSYADIPFEVAVISATRSPAQLLNLDRELGTIETNKRADLSVWTDDYQVIATIVGGIPVFGGAHLYRPSRASA